MRHPRQEIDSLQRDPGALLANSCRDASVHERQLHVVKRRGARQQIERLKHEPYFLVADARELVVVHIADTLAVQQVRPFRRRIQATNQIHER